MLLLSEISAITGGLPLRAQADFKISGITTDSRNVKTGDCFIALKGDKHDGAMFATEASKRGARCFIVEKDTPNSLPNVIIVKDSYRALLDLASAYRVQFSAKTIGVTGSCGKTTVKEAVAFLLGINHTVLSNEGNLNNHIGLPLTLFRLKKEHKFVVAEMGANHRGEIALLASVAKPDVGVIVNVNPVHLEGFGDIQAIYRTKLELAEYVNHQDGIIVTNGDDEILRSLVHSFKGRVFLFGRSKACHIRLTQFIAVGDEALMEVNKKYRFPVRTAAPFQAMNILCALTVLHALGKPVGYFERGLYDFKFPKGRFEAIPLESGATIYFDGYNANPAAFRASLEAFHHAAPEGRKIVLCGDMLELGDRAEEYHRQLGEGLAEYDLQGIIAVGQWRDTVIEAVRERTRKHIFARSFEHKEEAADFLRSILRQRDRILIKGSRRLQLESVIDDLKKIRRLGAMVCP
ncbi:MAG: UDP-N-acetylmuramoyl-tripeptide--D-alanyl-D-alanine ligase [Candidatus Omnitrophica bacterium]|nr:UDP-N-acetylmuramoyl-tripeptide--D-alanyl-D-alanine ligase [Candidatus Omnitrophota bacterium]